MAKKFSITDLMVGADVNETNDFRRATLRIQLLSVRDLVPSEENFYSVDEIAELKAAIMIFGVRQNLVVRARDDGKYDIVAGHRRYLSCLDLVNEGHPDFELVPCSIEYSSDELYKKLLLITTNSTARQLSDWEKVRQASELKELLTELKYRANIPGRVRDMIADTMGISSAQVGRMEAIENNLSEDFKGEMEKGNVGISAAAELAGLSEAEQMSAFEEYQQTGAVSVAEAKAKKAKKSVWAVAAEELEKCKWDDKASNGHGELGKDILDAIAYGAMGAAQAKRPVVSSNVPQVPPKSKHQSNDELIKLWANDGKRRAFIDTYKDWGVYAATQELNLTYYRYVLPDGAKIYVMEHMGQSYFGFNKRKWELETSLYLQKEEHFQPRFSSRSAISEHLMNLKDKLQKGEL